MRPVIKTMAHRQLDKENPLPLYHQLRMAILDRIASGEFRPNEAIPSERKLADAYGVSRITVVKALNELAQEGVLERRHGKGTYVASSPPRIPTEALARQAVGFMAPVLSDPYLFDIVRGVESVTAPRGYHLVMICSNEDPLREAQYIRTARQQGLAGLIVYPMQGEPNREALEQALGAGVPLVLVDRYYGDLNGDSVVCDDIGGACALTRHLLDQGHQRIAFVPWYEMECTSVQGRLCGYRRAHADVGLSPDDGLIWSDLYPRDASQEASVNQLRRLLAEGGATALFAVNFVVATFLLRDLWALGLRMPQDVSLVGFGLEQPSTYFPFPFTAAKQSGYQVGRAGARLLLGRVEQRGPDAPQKIVVPVPLVIDGTSGPAPENRVPV